MEDMSSVPAVTGRSTGQEWFRYTRIALSTPREFAEMLCAGESVVLLGPRYVGKRFVLSQIQEQLQGAGEHVCALRLLELELHNEQQFGATVLDELGRELAGLGWAAPTEPDKWSDSLRTFLTATACHLHLLVSDVDALPDHLARRLLKSLRTMVAPLGYRRGTLSVLLTGSVGLSPLVHGVDSDFNCTNQFVIQGFDREAFADRTDRLLDTIGWRLSDERACHDALFGLCGGNVYYLRVMLWALTEGRRIEGLLPDQPVTPQEILGASRHLYSPTSSPIEFAVHAFARVENSPSACTMVAGLIDAGHLSLSEAGVHASEPTEVELCGLAVRSGLELLFASPLVEQTARKYFTDWRLGDLFACNQDWERAFHYYDRAATRTQHWAYSPVVRLQLPSAVRAFVAAMHARAGQGERRLTEFFVRGAKDLLGFEEVTVWTHRRSWETVRMHGCDAGAQVPHRRWGSLLPSPAALKEGAHPLPEDVCPYAVLVGLPASRLGERLAVGLSNFRAEIPITRERGALCLSAADGYCRAFREASRIDSTEHEAALGKRLLETIPAILAAVKERSASTLTALQIAADKLRGVPYKRVMFSLVDPGRTLIRGVFDSRPDGCPDVANMTTWPISTIPPEDVQQLCVQTGTTLAIPDASTHPLTNKKVVTAAGIKSLVIVPIVLDGEVLGTLHVETLNGDLPGSDEIAALEYFADQLGQVIGLLERKNMIEAALDAEEEPLIVLDVFSRVRYVNDPAARQLQLEATGWQPLELSKDGGKSLYKRSLATVRSALRKDRRITDYYKGSKERGYEWLSLLAAPVHGWRGEQIGAVIQVHDLTSIWQLLQVIEKLAACVSREELIRQLLVATSELGHSWGRLYLKDPETGHLVGRAQYGYPERSPEAEAFEHGQVLLPDRGVPNSHSWDCFDRGEPVAFSYDPGRPDLEAYKTPSGLRVRNLVDPLCPKELTKLAGELWIDFPLYCRGTQMELGKLSLSCGEDFGPESFGILRVLAEVASALLLAAVKRQEAAEQEIAWQRRGALERAIAETAHHLLARIASLGVLRANYEVAAEQGQDIQELNMEFSSLLARLHEEFTRIKERFGPLLAIRERTDLVVALRSVLRRQLREHQFTFASASPEVQADVDTHLLENAMCELIANARKAKGADQAALHVSALLRVAGTGLTSMVVIEFSNNGPPIPRSVRHRVFDDLFSHWPGQSTGTGLGLGFVRRVAEAHGGVVRLGESREVATFVLEFPRFIRASGGTTP